MYHYDDHDRAFVQARAGQYADQLRRHLAGELSGDDFKALRLQNGWYLQRHAPMLRVAVPYGELSAPQLRGLARIAREFDRQDAGQATGRGGFGHFTTRQNVQFNWIALERSGEVMALLAALDLHGIQTSGNCIRNITTDALAGIAPDEGVDPRPYAEWLRQWSTLHPEFAFLPRKFKIALTGALEDRAATGWHDVGLTVLRNAHGEVGFRVAAGGGMGRTPLIASPMHDFVPWREVLVYLEALVRVYNLYGRRDNLYKARLKILVKAEGAAFVDAVRAEYESLRDDPATVLPDDEDLARIERRFFRPHPPRAAAPVDTAPLPAFERWRARCVHAHRTPGFAAVTLSLKRAGQAPGDATADQMDRAADLAERFSQGELRVTHDQNLLLPWVEEAELRALWLAAREDGLATPNIGLLTDLIACPGGDLCALANARTLPIAAAIAARYDDLDELHDIGDIDLHVSGCINSCGHHHSGHIGILGVDKDGAEWYQITLAGSDGTVASGPAQAGRVVGPSFAADEVPDVLEAVVGVYLEQRVGAERFVDTARRLGLAPFRQATDAVRHASLTAR